MFYNRRPNVWELDRIETNQPLHWICVAEGFSEFMTTAQPKYEPFSMALLAYQDPDDNYQECEPFVNKDGKEILVKSRRGGVKIGNFFFQSATYLQGELSVAKIVPEPWGKPDYSLGKTKVDL